MLAIAGEVSLVRSIGRISRNGADRKGKLPSNVTLPGAELPGRAGLRPAWWPVRIHKYKQLEISGCLYLRIVTGLPARRAGPGSSRVVSIVASSRLGVSPCEWLPLTSAGGVPWHFRSR